LFGFHKNFRGEKHTMPTPKRPTIPDQEFDEAEINLALAEIFGMVSGPEAPPPAEQGLTDLWEAGFNEADPEA
jgi:hypothetical protein